MASISSLLWFVLPALLSAIFVLALIGPARHVGLVDHPVGRKNHSVPTPLVGGVAIFLSLGLTHLLGGDIPLAEPQPGDCVACHRGHRGGRRRA